jgi:Ca-activated chloride channel family protein
VGETRVSRILEGVERDNKANARVFVFGVGDDVNTQLLDKLSNDNHGTRTYVRPEENIETSVSSLYNKIASPVLSDLRLDVDGVKIEDVHPSRLPDLFRGSQLTVLGRYRGDGPARITLRGSAAGKDQVFTYSVDFPQRERASNFLPRLWATRRVGFLLEQIRLNGESKELVAEVTDLATRYGILTPYTSFLVLEPGMRSELGDRFAAGRDGKDGVPGMPGLAGRPGTEGRNGRDGRGAGGGPMAAPAPTTPTGGAAVARSKADAELKEADKPMAAKPGERIEHAGGKTFYLTEGVWLDSLWPKDTTKATIIKVKYVSDAWFDLPGLRAELKEILALGEKVKVKLGDVLLVIGDEGLEKLTDAVRKQIKG